jgi:hypothetical protein
MKVADRPDIVLPDGHTLRPVRRLAAELKLHPRTVARMNLACVEIGGCMYTDVDATLTSIGARLKRRNETPARKRRAA